MSLFFRFFFCVIIELVKYVKKLNKFSKVFILVILGLLLIFIIDYIRINIRYFVTRSNYEETFKVYGNRNKYVPQGLSYSKKYNIVLQTSYSKDVSKVFVIDFKSGKLIKDLKLINKDGTNSTKHVGGITTDDDKVWISNDYELDVYNLDDIINTKKGSIEPLEEIKLPIRGDFCYFDDNTLWIGEFYLKPFYDVDGGVPKLNAYKLKDNIDFNKPDTVKSLPKAVQGMVIFPDGKVGFTQSFTFLVNSNLSIYKDMSKFNKKNHYKTIKIPPMAEGMFYKDGYLYILFESSTDKYFLADPKMDKVIKYNIKKIIK